MMKGELQELGEEVDENVTSISKMQTQILNFTGGKVNIFNDDGTFKSTYEIMDGISEIYDEILEKDETAAAELLETIAGKNRANDVASLISNWEQVEKAKQSALDAEGTATEENEKYLENLQGKLDTLNAAWQALSNTFMKEDFLKNLIDTGTNVLVVLDKLVGFLGSIPTIIGGVAAAMSLKGVGELINQFHFNYT